MRATLFFPLLALALISSAGAQQQQQQQSPLACKACWAKCRNEISECQNLPPEDMEKLSVMSDSQIANIPEDHNLYPLRLCLCELAGKAVDILKLCEKSCPQEMSDGLQSESSIVSNGICNVPNPKAKLATDEDSSTNNGEDKPETGGSNSEPNSQDNNTPSAGGASSVQWSGALLTVVAAMVSAVAF